MKTALVLILAAATAFPRLDPQICGAHPDRAREEMALHRQSRLRRSFTKSSRQAGVATVARDLGNIAVIDDTDGVVARRNAFNLDLKSIRFTPTVPAASHYRFEVGAGGFDQDAAANGDPVRELDDDDSRLVTLPFPFPFYGKTYSEIYLISDGNLNFEVPDTSTSERSLGRMTAGPPRIAPFFQDLDPSLAPNSVRISARADRIVFSWVNVPEYQMVGFGPPNNFQATLYPDGGIVLAYRGVTSSSAVAGIAPGGLQGANSVVSFNAGGGQEYGGAVVERFTDQEEIDMVFTAQKFFETHEDVYDYLAVYNALGIQASSGAVAYELTVRSNRLGIGDPPGDAGAFFGSKRRLQAVLNMGPLSQYPIDPNDAVPARASSRDTPLTVLGHEAGHLWLAYASVRDPANRDARPALNPRNFAHWSFAFNSEASLLEGNRIRDDGEGATPRFTTVATAEGYAPLDQYLMGLRAPEEVPPTFLVTDPTTPPSRLPQPGVSFNGGRRDIGIEEIIAAEGPRIPDATVSQRRFRMAVILIAASGVTPSEGLMAQVDGYRQGFEAFFAKAAGDRAAVDTSIRRALQLSLEPAAGVVQGATATASISLSQPAEADLTVLLQAPNGATSVPGSVTIPAGERQASFEVAGVAAGVEELSAEPDDTRYATAYARVQVRDSASALRLVVVSRDKQQVVLKVTDGNNLPYPGMEVVASGTGDPQSASSDADGLVRLPWTPGSFQASLTAAPDVAITLTAP